MPQPAAIQELENPLLRAYAEAWKQVVDEQQGLVDDPRNAVKRRRLTEMRSRIEKVMDELDDTVHDWLTHKFPEAYALGGSTGAAEAGGEFVWSQIHQEAVQELVNRTWDNLLSATKHVRDDTKRLIRTIASDQTLQKTIQGRTAVDAGRRMTELLKANGIKAVTYKDGTQHGLEEYGQMVVRTESATAYNAGTINAGAQLGVTYWECFDGPDCGWSFHESPDLASGKIVTQDEAMAFPISHPNCRRAFGPRPDIVTPEQAKAAAGGQVLPEQTAAVREADASRLGRRSGSPVNRLVAREKKLRQPPKPELQKYRGLLKDQIAGVRGEHEQALAQSLEALPELSVPATPAVRVKAQNEAIHKWLEETNPNPLDFDITPRLTLDPEAALKADKTVADAMGWYQKVFSKDAFENYNAYPAWVDNQGKQRAFYNAGTVSVGGRKARITVHEFGHHLENGMKGWQIRAKAFLRERRGEEKLTEIYRGTGEMGWKDKFVNHYMGKSYPTDTEIISMGMEFMYAEPARLLQKDPDYFWFMAGLLRGQIVTNG